MALKTFMLTSLLLVCMGALPKAISAQRSVGKTYERIDEISPDILPEPRKRPFCNAFTGCGRKRSSAPQEQLMQENKNFRRIPLDEESILDMSAEPVIDDLSRQIIAEAKMWEALQETGAELMKRRQFQKNVYPGSINLQ